MFYGSIVIELKYGNGRDEYPVALAGYAMALESSLEIPVDFGLLITINSLDDPKPSIKPYYLSNAYRQQFIESRDEVIDILLSQQKPPKPSQCPSTCPFKEFCR